MRASPLQARTIGFVSINVNPRNLEPKDPRGLAFEWEGVNIGSRVSILERPKDAESANVHLLMLEITLDESVGRVVAPYNLKVSAWGAFEFLDDEMPEEEALDLIAVNGTSMLYSAIRELVSSVTARMPNQQLMLPTAHFMDEKPSLKKSKPKRSTASEGKTPHPKKSTKAIKAAD